MAKEEIYELMDAFTKETWKFPIRNDSLDDDMEYICKIMLICTNYLTI